MLYYHEIRSLDELLGEDGVLRLPNYLVRTFVSDRARELTFDEAFIQA